jgi:hypothetical protein
LSALVPHHGRDELPRRSWSIAPRCGHGDHAIRPSLGIVVEETGVAPDQVLPFDERRTARLHNIPAGAFFNIEVDFLEWGDPEDKMMTRKAKIFPGNGEELKMEDGNNSDCYVQVKRYPDSTVIDVKIVANWPNVH